VTSPRENPHPNQTTFIFNRN